MLSATEAPCSARRITDARSLVQINRALPAGQRVATLGRRELDRALNDTARTVVLPETLTVVALQRAIEQVD
jgi:hypothetical protein